jgi:hypothetical protein
MPDGTVVKNVPDNITQADLLARYNAFKTPDTRGNIITSDVPTVAGEVPNPPVAQEPQRTMMDKLNALYEVPLAVGTGMLAAPVSSAYGVAKSVASPQFGTQASVQQGQQAAKQLSQQMAYQPTSPVSQDVLQGISSVAESTKIPVTPGGIGQIPSFAQQARNVGQVIRPMANQAIQTAKPTVSNMVQALRREPQSTMAGVGAAEVPEAVARVQLANQLRVPGTVSKGQALRDLGEQKFEIETPKQFPELGKPLIEEQAKRNDTILQNFDAYVDATGKETFGLRETGRIVDKALVNEANKRKAEINAAYTAAREAGETQQPLPYAPLKAYINQQTPTVKRKLAPILSAVDEEIARNDPKKTGQISINNLEDIYQFINKNYEPGTPAGTYAKEMKDLINQITEGQGGELYQIARQKRTKFGKEFENVGYIDKLLRQKPGTTDRAVAFEDVFDHAILNGSRDDVAAIGRTLKKAGPEGQQAWKELQGQTIQYMKDQVTKSTDVDSFGNPIVSPAKFKAVVTTLDQDGKLDYLFGKKGAQEIKDLLDYTMTVNNPLKGAANYSNTASALITALDKVNQTPLGRIPGLGSMSKFIVEKGKESALKKKIEESINYKPEDMAKALKGK